MKVSIDAPVKPAANYWEAVCQNKKTIAKVVTAGAVVAALAAFFYSQGQSLDQMRSDLFAVAESAEGIENTLEGGGMTIGTFREKYNPCPYSYSSFQLDVDLSKSNPNMSGLYKKVSEFYNDATSCGADLFSSFTYYAKLDSVSEKSDTVKAVFGICRSKAISNFYNALRA